MPEVEKKNALGRFAVSLIKLTPDEKTHVSLVGALSGVGRQRYRRERQKS